MAVSAKQAAEFERTAAQSAAYGHHMEAQHRTQLAHDVAVESMKRSQAATIVVESVAAERDQAVAVAQQRLADNASAEQRIRELQAAYDVANRTNGELQQKLEEEQAARQRVEANVVTGAPCGAGVDVNAMMAAPVFASQMSTC